ncbi:carbohydrate ABC transporter permease [Nonomuraea purpurea]|uniref:Carbohydrate ABC transporter permease n=1 Tax=Nonomuraea purpurea TaxID=1849276 RepID=A0ABV8G5Z0_9ACTN
MKRTRRQHLIVYLGLGLGLVLVIGPFLWTALSSVKPEREIRRDPPTFWPQSWTLDNFTELFDRVSIGTAFANSMIVALVLVATNLLFCSMVGYAFAKLSFRGRDLAFGLVLVQLAIPAIVVMMPQFVLIARFGLVNTFVGIILPTMVAPLGVFMMRQFISDLPDELIHAARVDGAREFRIFFTIILPLCGPALATLGLITFLGAWNNFLWPAVVAQSENMYTLPVALNILNGHESTHYNLLVAGSVVVIAPILFLFVFLQRFFVQGVATSGLK